MTDARIRESQIQEINNTIVTIGKKLEENLYVSLTNIETTLMSEKALVKTRQDEIKENIRELLSSAENKAEHLQEIIVDSQSMEHQKSHLKAEVAKNEKQKKEMEKVFADIASTITHKKEALKSLESKANSSQEETAISRNRSHYSLYSKLFTIKWDHTVPSGTVKGFILKPEERRVVPFKVEKTSNSQFFITNYLWKQIGAGSVDQSNTHVNNPNSSLGDSLHISYK